MSKLHDTMTKLFSEHQDKTARKPSLSKRPTLQMTCEEVAANPYYLPGAAAGKDYIVP